MSWPGTQQYVPPMTPPPPPKKRSAARMLLLVVGAGALLGFLSLRLGALITDRARSLTGPPAAQGVSQGMGTQNASGDVAIDRRSCGAHYGVLTCTLNITNHSDGTSNYYVEADVYDRQDVKIGMGTGVAQNVRGHARARTEFVATFEGKWKRVEITKVQRTASP